MQADLGRFDLADGGQGDQLAGPGFDGVRAVQAQLLVAAVGIDVTGQAHKSGADVPGLGLVGHYFRQDPGVALFHHVKFFGAEAGFLQDFPAVQAAGLVVKVFKAFHVHARSPQSPSEMPRPRAVRTKSELTSTRL